MSFYVTLLVLLSLCSCAISEFCLYLLFWGGWVTTMMFQATVWCHSNRRGHKGSTRGNYLFLQVYRILNKVQSTPDQWGILTRQSIWLVNGIQFSTAGYSEKKHGFDNSVHLIWTCLSRLLTPHNQEKQCLFKTWQKKQKLVTVQSRSYSHSCALLFWWMLKVRCVCLH